MTRSLFLSASVALGLGLAVGPFLASAQSPSVIRSFERIQLSDQFWCEGASFGDFNKDGKNDIVAGPWWWEGPDFKTKREIYEPAATFERALGPQTKVKVPGFEGGLGSKNTYSDNFFAYPTDFNADGWMDVLIIGFPGKATAWYENPKGADQRWARHPVFLRTDNESPTFTDITGDGKPELVCITDGAYGYAEPDWSAPTVPWKWHRISPNRNYGNFTHGLGVGDVNGDGKADLIEREGWWEQPASLAGDPEWKHHAARFSGPGGAQMYAYDVNGDGLNDVVTSLAAHAFGLAWHEQIKGESGTVWKQHTIIGETPSESPYGVKFSELHAVELVDMNGDGLKDIVTGKRFWSHGRIGDPDRNDEAVLYWFELTRGPKNDAGKHSVEWVPHLIDKESGVGTQVVVGDVDANGTNDIVIGNKKGIFVLKHTAKPASAEEVAASRPQPQPATPEAKNIKPTKADGSALNVDFEAGSLTDWTAEGKAFDAPVIKGDAVNARRKDMRSGHAGEHWVGSYEAAGDDVKGTLTSAAFPVAHPYASFLIGGGNTSKTRVDIINALNGSLIATSNGPNAEEMVRVSIDLRPVQGASIKIRLVDEGTGSWGHLNFDDFLFHDHPPRGAKYIGH